MNEFAHSDLLTRSLKNDTLRSLLDTLPQGLLFIDRDGSVLYANNKAREICHIESREGAAFQNYCLLINSEEKVICDLVNESLQYKNGIQRQFSKDETIYLIESQPAFSQDDFIGCAISFSDITPMVRKEQQHELIYQISSALSFTGTSDLTHILKIALNQILKSLKITSVNIMLLDTSSQTLRIKVDSNHQKADYSPRSFKLGEGIAGKCAQELRPYTEYDVAKSKLFVKKDRNDHGSLLVVPIASQGRLLGVINAQDESNRYFTETEVQFLTIVANEIAIAIENTLLYDRLNSKIELLMKLFTVSTLMSDHSVDSRTQQIINIVPKLIDAQVCLVHIYSSAQEKFLLKYKSDINIPIPPEISVKDGNARTLKEVFFSQKTLIVNKPEQYHSVNRLKKTGIHNFLCMPLTVGNKPVGVISVINKLQGEFDREDINLLTITGLRIATEMENIQLVKQLGSEKELLDKTINNISEGVVVLNRRRKVIVWNDYLEELTGINPDDALGQPCYRIFYNLLGLKRITKEIYLPDYSTHPSYVDSDAMEEEMRTSNGDNVWVRAHFSRIFNKNGNVENTVIVFRNITKEREFLRAKNEFVSLATHELRTPLTAVKGYLSMISSTPQQKMNALQKKYLAKASQSTERLVYLVEQLLDVVRIEEERVELNTASFVLNDLIQETIEDLGQKAHAKNIKIEYQPRQKTHVFADREKTKQILDNITDNAIKYTKQGGTIDISMERINNNMVVAIRDDGVGIPKKHLNEIFERFVRIDNPLSIKAGGTGLGLYIVKNLVKQQGGDIWVSSHVGKGTTFYFTLPLENIKPPLKPIREESYE